MRKSDMWRAVLGSALLVAGFAAFGQSAPPPRSVADVLAVLEQYKPDPEQVNRLKAEVAKQPPQTADPVDLRRFYLDRGLAAGQLGLVAQQLADLRKALELTPPGDSERYNIYGQVAAAEMQAGDFAAAMKMWLDAPRAARLSGQQLAAWTSVSTSSAAFGDLKTARTAHAQAEGLLTSLQTGTNFARPYFENNWRALVERSRAGILRLEGKHAEAELSYRQVLMLWDRQIEEIYPRIPQQFSPPPLSTYQRAAVFFEAMNLAPTLLEQGKYAEAEAAARNALKRALGFFGKYSPETGVAVTRLASTVFEQGRFGEARALAEAALGIQGQIGASPVSSTSIFAQRIVGAALVEEGEYAQADQAFARLREAVLKQPETAERLGTGSPSWVYAQVRLGKSAAAVEQARRIYENQHKRYGDAFYHVVEARGLHALALAADGRHEEALREFRAAIPVLLAAASERTGEEGFGIAKARRLTRILDAYIALLGRFAAGGKPVQGVEPVGEAFLVSDFARGSSVQRALVAASARAAIRDPELAKLAREEQDAGQRAASLTGILVDLLSRPPEKSLPAVIAAMRRDIEDLRKRRAELKQEIAKRFPDYANLIDPKPVALEAARRTLLPGEALIVLYGTDERTFVWAVPREGQARFHAAALGRPERDRLVATLRKALDVGDAPLERFPRFDIAAAHKLFAELLAPVEPAWGGAKSLLVIPHGSLGQLPFALLVTQPGELATSGLPFEGYRRTAWLLRRAAVTQLSSVNTLASLRSVQRAKAPSRPFAGFGDPVFGPQQLAQAAPVATRSLRLRSAAFDDPQAARKALSTRLAQLTRLPDTAEELEGIAKALGAAAEQDLLLGVKASETAVKSADLSDRRVIAFATHGLVPGDLDGLTQPALALSNPQVTGEKDADGLLAMDEILALKLNADWVVLSACNTASSGGASEEAVSGLGRAFFYAGARALLVSNWPVETVSAKLLTTDIFRRQATDAKLARAEALRQAMLHLMDNETGKGRDGKPLFSYAHPMFWAPFSLVGDGN
jgi:CHAT domain-containing protein